VCVYAAFGKFDIFSPHSEQHNLSHPFFSLDELICD
jgi:hypothetical protein